MVNESDSNEPCSSKEMKRRLADPDVDANADTEIPAALAERLKITVQSMRAAGEAPKQVQTSFFEACDAITETAASSSTAINIIQRFYTTLPEYVKRLIALDLCSAGLSSRSVHEVSHISECWHVPGIILVSIYRPCVTKGFWTPLCRLSKLVDFPTANDLICAASLQRRQRQPAKRGASAPLPAYKPADVAGVLQQFLEKANMTNPRKGSMRKPEAAQVSSATPTGDARQSEPGSRYEEEKEDEDAGGTDTREEKMSDKAKGKRPEQGRGPKGRRLTTAHKMAPMGPASPDHQHDSGDPFADDDDDPFNDDKGLPAQIIDEGLRITDSPSVGVDDGYLFQVDDEGFRPMESPAADVDDDYEESAEMGRACSDQGESMLDSLGILGNSDNKDNKENSVKSASNSGNKDNKDNKENPVKSASNSDNKDSKENSVNSGNKDDKDDKDNSLTSANTSSSVLGSTSGGPPFGCETSPASPPSMLAREGTQVLLENKDDGEEEEEEEETRIIVTPTRKRPRVTDTEETSAEKRACLESNQAQQDDMLLTSPLSSSSSSGEIATEEGQVAACLQPRQMLNDVAMFRAMQRIVGPHYPRYLTVDPLLVVVGQPDQRRPPPLKSIETIRHNPQAHILLALHLRPPCYLHWVLAAVSRDTKTILIYDSLRSADSITQAQELCGCFLMRFLGVADRHEKDSWQLIQRQCFQQPNGFDCGVAALVFAIGIVVSCDGFLPSPVSPSPVPPSPVSPSPVSPSASAAPTPAPASAPASASAQDQLDLWRSILAVLLVGHHGALEACLDHLLPPRETFQKMLLQEEVNPPWPVGISSNSMTSTTLGALDRQLDLATAYIEKIASLRRQAEAAFNEQHGRGKRLVSHVMHISTRLVSENHANSTSKQALEQKQASDLDHLESRKQMLTALEQHPSTELASVLDHEISNLEDSIARRKAEIERVGGLGDTMERWDAIRSCCVRRSG